MFTEEFEQNYMSNLNSQQKEAVQSIDGPILLLAVPGSGKTTVLVTRLGYMVHCCGIDPNYILTMTYTNSATTEMTERFASLYGEEYAKAISFKTINRLANEIILYYVRTFSRNIPFELIVDESVIKNILRSIYQVVNKEYPDDSTISDLRTSIAYIKNMMLTPDDIESLDTTIKNLPILYNQYCEKLKKERKMDFDDQLSFALKFLTSIPQVLDHFQNKYRYICVDESQDTSKIQHEIISLLAQKHRNIFMVGDEDQSIYGFRAAYPEALLNFSEVYPDAKVLLMETNYRSVSSIVKSADRFISKNHNRHTKTMCASRPEENLVQIIHAIKRETQLKYLLEIARNCSEETAVLYRNNDNALPLIDLLERNNIPYKTRKSEETFFNNRVIADVTDIIHFAYDLRNTEIFMRIYYKFGVPISKKDAELACKQSQASGKTILEELLKIPEMKVLTKEGIRDLIIDLPQIPESDAATAISLIRIAGYSKYIERQGLDFGKIEILFLLGLYETDALGLLRRLEELQSIVQQNKRNTNADFILSTIHSSKGLEYKRVFLLDIFDGLLPQSPIQSYSEESAALIKQYEEERRLFYVAMTRAKDELYMFECQDRPSAFISEIEKTLPTEVSDEYDPQYIFGFLKQDMRGKIYKDKSDIRYTISAYSDNSVLIESENGDVRLTDIDEMFMNRSRTKKYSLSLAELEDNSKY